LPKKGRAILLKVVEAFAGIGAQKQALEKAQIEHEIINTIEWDINAIFAYDVMHHNDLTPSELSKAEIIEKLENLTLSPDGKKPITTRGLKQMPESKLQLLYAAIQRNKNLCDITKVTGQDIPDDTDLLTYSFPCQDLSNGSAFHNANNGGIEKGAGTRSGLLWEVERILKERFDAGQPLPKFLLMENVNAINSPRHNPNFVKWQEELIQMGYTNKVYKGLNARDFGVPQNRSRTFMLSVLAKDLDPDFDIDSLEFKKDSTLADYLRIGQFPAEESAATPNQTPSRLKIRDENKHLAEGNQVTSEFTNTISTKQDRNPNAGVIIKLDGDMRYLTPRESFLLMGFPEEKFEKLKAFNDEKKYFSDTHAWKMAGNSIVVDVLVEIFNEIERLKAQVFK
jgi:DNA (cytosine-5)-methyltransferase 1